MIRISVENGVVLGYGVLILSTFIFGETFNPNLVFRYSSRIVKIGNWIKFFAQNLCYGIMLMLVNYLAENADWGTSVLNALFKIMIVFYFAQFIIMFVGLMFDAVGTLKIVAEDYPTGSPPKTKIKVRS